MRQTITRTFFFLSAFSVLSHFCFGQKQPNDSLETVITAIAQSNIYEVSYQVGFAGTISEQFNRYKQLQSLATDQRLTDLATHNENAVVRLYVFQALKQRHTTIPNDLVTQFQKDKTIVTKLDGCYGSEETVSKLSKQNLAFHTNFNNVK